MQNLKCTLLHVARIDTTDLRKRPLWYAAVLISFRVHAGSHCPAVKARRDPTGIGWQSTRLLDVPRNGMKNTYPP